ncbi:TPR end-of-group domain-containing protein [Thiomicrospira pelophila]|uniref:TPR end-of-group domain-containing protein n=1 Tax=Thiomicrospira pelophila TaxID=934 RepID=UPI001B802FF5|nr:tetratricopeptide repeat protein [Thiomicrospira pelophila]
MKKLTGFIMVLVILMPMLAKSVWANNNYTADQPQPNVQDDHAVAVIEGLEEPMYSAFIERYILDELKQLRIDMANQRVEIVREVVDREMTVADRSLGYATNTVTYFFYLILGVSTVLVWVGWTSIRDIKERVHSLAEQKVTKLVTQYEARLRAMEHLIEDKTQSIDSNKEQIERTQELHALWLRAEQEHSAANKVKIYDQILVIDPTSVEAYTYKADAVLEMDEPRWAINLCHQALQLDPENAFAFFQLGCAYAQLEQYEEAVRFLTQTLSYSETYREEIESDPLLAGLRQQPIYQNLITDKVLEKSVV